METYGHFRKDWLNSFCSTFRAYPCVLSQILTCMTFNEFVVFNWSDHSGKSSHDIIQLLHLLWVTSLQHWEREGGKK